MAEGLAYRVVLHTSDVRGAATDANVFVDLHGQHGASGKWWVQPAEAEEPQQQDVHGKRRQRRKPFQRGSTDVCDVEAPHELGELVRCRVGHDGAGFGSGWHLESVHVEHPSGTRRWFFPCTSWLDTSSGDGAIERVLVPAAPEPEQIVGGGEQVRGAEESEAAVGGMVLLAGPALGSGGGGGGVISFAKRKQVKLFRADGVQSVQRQRRCGSDGGGICVVPSPRSCSDTDSHVSGHALPVGAVSADYLRACVRVLLAVCCVGDDPGASRS